MMASITELYSLSKSRFRLRALNKFPISVLPTKGNEGGCAQHYRLLYNVGKSGISTLESRINTLRNNRDQ